MKLRLTFAVDAPGFCTSTQVSKPGPVLPSAKYQSADGALTPTESCPSDLPP